jgi:quercetin dioxygenase-like cupin family protein
MKNKEYTDLVDNKNYPADPLVPLDPPFVDERGKIQNLVNCKIGAVAIIESKAGTERSNHWHKKNSHYLYVITGEVIYYERNIDGSNVVKETYKSGQMIFTPPNKVHKTVFTKDTVMVSLGMESKEHDLHEEDLVREVF